LVIAHIGNGKSTNRYHLPYSLNRPEKIKIKYIYQRTLRQTVWEKIDGVEYTDNLEKVLSDSEVDVVVVNTPSEAHYATAKKVLEAGKHCVVEKPFATNVEDAADLFKTAKEKGVTVQCYQNRRFDSDFLTVQKVIESGKLGKIFEVCMHYDYYRAEVPEKEKTFNRDHAFIYTHACHTVEQVLSYFGKPQKVISDVRQLLGAGRMNDYFDLDFFYDGLKVTVQSSYFRAKIRPSFEVYGMRGTFIKAEQDKQEADLKKFYLPAGHADFGIDAPENYGTIIYYDDAGIYHEEKVKSEIGDYARFYDALYETIINGAPQLVTEEQTMEQMKILEKAGKKLA
jgi:predicted dehydrogenase